MPGLDTNVLVRWLVEDDDDQAARVQRLFEAARMSQLPLFVPSTVALELEWVLRSRYRFDKAIVLQAFNALLETHELEFQSEDALERALHLYRQGTAEFADCLHAGICGVAERCPLMTLDKKAARLPKSSCWSHDAAAAGYAQPRRPSPIPVLATRADNAARPALERAPGW